MSCPLFIPSSPLGDLVDIAPPLGDLYGGACEVDPSEVVAPETIRRYCNFGYARGHCERAAQSDADAARFLVKAERNGVAVIAWSLERDHHPVAVGSMEVAIAPGVSPPATSAGATLARQATACAAAYGRLHP